MSINGHKTNIHKVKERKEKKNIRTSLHPSKYINTPSNKKFPYTNSLSKYKTTLNPKLLSFFVTNDKG